VSFRLDDEEIGHIPRLHFEAGEEEMEPVIGTPRGIPKHRANPDPQYGRHKLPPLHMLGGCGEDVCLASSTSEEEAGEEVHHMVRVLTLRWWCEVEQELEEEYMSAVSSCCGVGDVNVA
jgi:hypothetical protein